MFRTGSLAFESQEGLVQTGFAGHIASHAAGARPVTLGQRLSESGDRLIPWNENPSSWAISRWDLQEIPAFSETPSFTRTPLWVERNQLSYVLFIFYGLIYFKINLIRCGSMTPNCLFPSGFRINILCAVRKFPSHLRWYHHRNTVYWKFRIINLVIMPFFPSFSCLIPLSPVIFLSILFSNTVCVYFS
jgi:hypothetical protein